jgi:Calcineurin-like phosphoesterase/Purple acid Phosphatase, N-terminal domain/Fibronectin type III domain
MNPNPLRARARLLRSLLVACTLLCGLQAVADVLVPAGSLWRFRDDGSNQGTLWRRVNFDDSTWATGPAELGYGDGDEDTVVSYGPNAAQKHVTTYFRHSFQVADPTAFTSLVLSLLRDDGAMVYLNNTLVWRSNMPSGAVSSTTLATTALGTPEEATFYDLEVASSLLRVGKNVVAVEVHQADVTSTDVSFDLRLEGLTTISVTRGPYLQMGTPTSVNVRWRTNGATDSRVRYGTSPTDLNIVVDNGTVTNEHEVVLSALTPGTRYYYSVGSTAQVLAGDASYTFVTAPSATTPTRIWILGDSGAPNAEARAVRDAYYTFTGTTHTNLWLMLGDNAYEDGTDAEYQAAVFNMYPTMLRQSVLWPTLGNHDTAHSSTVTPALPYFQMFTLPTNGEAGGVASGTEKYYSFDYGNIHFVCLDSMTSDRSVTGPMLTWLQSDLAATTKQWIVAFWHHPPYSKGSHDSDDETELVQMRTNALPILEDYGVDLVLSGHSHSYERSYLLDSHYGTSSTLISAMKKDDGSGRPEDTGAYEKPTSGMAPHEGAVYAVAGSSSVLQGGALNHPAMFISLLNYGSMVLDVNGNRMDAKFLRENGTVADSFTIIKGLPPEAPAAPAGLSATAVSTTQIDLTWTDTSSNEERFTINRCTGTAAVCNADPSLYAMIAQPGPDEASYIDPGLAPATTYTYRIRAENEFGNSAFSDSATATTSSVPPPAAPTNVIARAISDTTIRVTWTPVVDATGYEILRRAAGTPETVIGTSPNATFDDDSADSGEAYLYSVRAVNDGGASAVSANDLATAIVFTDGSLTAGTIVKKVHIEERRAAVNAVRALAGLSPFTFVDSPIVQSVHIQQLRTALDHALGVLGRPTGGYTDTIGSGVPIRAVHFREIANRVQ